MTLGWSREDSPVWDADKQRIIGGTPAGVFDLACSEGEALPGDWFAATDGDRVVGYGWLDVTWGGDAEVTFAVDPEQQGKGVGSWVVEQIEQEASSRGVNYVYNTVRDTHPRRDEVHDWLLVRGYQGNERDASLRKRVGLESAPRAAPAAPQPTTEMPADSRGPGHEEAGGYVDPEDHRY